MSESGKKEVRVGNFLVTLYSLEDVPVIEVSNMESTWLVRIPADFQMYGILNRLLLDMDDDDMKVRDNACEWLRMFFLNWQNVTGIPSGHYHQGILMLTCAYNRPELLKSSFFGAGRDFMSDVKKLRKSFLKWADARDAVMMKEESSFDSDGSEIADVASEILRK